MNMNNIFELLLTLGFGEYTENHFYYLLQKQENLVTLGILTLSLSILARNKVAIMVQSLLFVAFWFQSWTTVLFQIFLGDLGRFQIWHDVLYVGFVTIQIISFALILYELKETIKRETPKK
jgi:hypothetical protein